MFNFFANAKALRSAQALLDSQREAIIMLQNQLQDAYEELDRNRKLHYRMWYSATPVGYHEQQAQLATEAARYRLMRDSLEARDGVLLDKVIDNLILKEIEGE